MQQGIRKLQWFEYLKVVFLEILNPLLCRVFANQVTNGHLYCYVTQGIATNSKPIASYTQPVMELDTKLGIFKLKQYCVVIYIFNTVV